MIEVDPLAQSLDEDEECCDDVQGRKERQDRARYDKKASSILAGSSREALQYGKPTVRGALTARFKLCEITPECLDVMAWVLFAEWSRMNGVRCSRDEQYRVFAEDILGRLLRVHKYSGMHKNVRREAGNMDDEPSEECDSSW